jgi:hypothetical protein
MKKEVFLRNCMLGCFLYIAFSSLLAQDTNYFSHSEKQLLTRYSAILAESPFSRENIAKLFFDEFYCVVSHDSSFSYPFNSLDKIGRIYSPDQRIRIYTWNIPINIDDNIYFGIIQFYSKHEKKYKSIQLFDTQKKNQKITADEWPGALYYQIAESKNAGQIYYTLLGLDLNNLLTNKKIIDILTINDSNEISFCSKLFEYNQKLVDRLIFEYSEKAVMTLRYDERKKMIVLDHLSPQKPSLEGNYQFYGPDFTYDGLKFEKGIWKYYSNIDITN